MKTPKLIINVAAGVALLLGVGSASAVPFTFEGTGTNPATGDALDAKAVFDIVGGNLQVTLSNLGDAAKAPSDVLLAVFFSLNGNPTLTPISAALGGSSTLRNPQAGHTIGGNWQYANGLSGTPGGASSGISGAGYGIFGDGNFGVPEDHTDGFNWGIVNGVSASANNPTKNATLIDNSIVFTLDLPVGYTLTSVSDVSFQYGTSLTEPNIPPHIRVPDGGATLGLLGLALVGTETLRRRMIKA